MIDRRTLAAVLTALALGAIGNGLLAYIRLEVLSSRYDMTTHSLDETRAEVKALGARISILEASVSGTNGLLRSLRSHLDDSSRTEDKEAGTGG